MNKKEIRGAKTKAMLLQVAAAEFMEKNYEEITINDICKKADATKGAFYHHFTSKDDIFRISITNLYYERLKEFSVDEITEKLSLEEKMIGIAKLSCDVINELKRENLRKYYSLDLKDAYDLTKSLTYVSIYTILLSEQNIGALNMEINLDELSREFYFSIYSNNIKWIMSDYSFNLIEEIVYFIKLVFERYGI